MTKKKVIEPLEMVRNIITEFDTQINSTESTIKYISKSDSPNKEELLLEYNGFLETLKKLKHFVIYEA